MGFMTCVQAHQKYDSVAHYPGIRYEVKNEERYSRDLFIQGKNLAERGSLSEALEIFTSIVALHHRQQEEDRFGVYEVINQMALVHTKTGNHERALEIVQKNVYALSNAAGWNYLTDNPALDQVVLLPASIRTLAIKARVLKSYFKDSNKSEYLQASLKTYRLCVEALVKARKTWDHEQTKPYHIDTSRSLISEALNACIDGKEVLALPVVHEYAFWFIEQGRSLSWQERMPFTLMLKTIGVLPAFSKALDTLKRRHKLLLRQVQGLKQEDSILSCFQEIKKIESQHDSIEKIIQDVTPGYFERTDQHAPASLGSYQAWAGDADNLFSYFQGGTAFYLLAADNRESMLARINDVGHVVNGIEEVLDILGNARRGSDSLLAARLNELYKLLLSPGREILSPGDRLTVFPDGHLNSLPFSLLLEDTPFDKPYASWPFLIASYPVSYGHSVGAAIRPVTKKVSRQNYLGVAPSYAKASKNGFTTLNASPLGLRGALGELIYNQEEVTKARALFGGSVLLGDSATKGNFLDAAGSASILHLGMYAFAAEQTFDYSGLVFADFDPGKGIASTGFLSLSELSKLRLNTEIALLSASETAPEPVERGGGVVSLGRAFKMAGCPTIAMSLWKANDYATSKIMGYFTRNLSNGMPKDHALQLAKLKYLQDADVNTSHPYFWATFVLRGDPAPMHFTAYDYTWAWVVVVLLMIVLLTGSFYINKLAVKRRRKTNPRHNP